MPCYDQRISIAMKLELAAFSCYNVHLLRDTQKHSARGTSTGKRRQFCTTIWGSQGTYPVSTPQSSSSGAGPTARNAAPRRKPRPFWHLQGSSCPAPAHSCLCNSGCNSNYPREHCSLPRGVRACGDRRLLVSSRNVRFLIIKLGFVLFHNLILLCVFC